MKVVYNNVSIYLSEQITIVSLIHLLSMCQEKLMSRERVVDSEDLLIHGGFLMAGGTLNSWMVCLCLCVMDFWKIHLETDDLGHATVC